MKSATRRLLCVIATLHAALAGAQPPPLGHPLGTIHPKSVPVDSKAADDRQRRQVSEDPTQVRRIGERDSYSRARDAMRQPAEEGADQRKAERDSRQVNPQAESPNRGADAPSRDR